MPISNSRTVAMAIACRLVPSRVEQAWAKHLAITRNQRASIIEKAQVLYIRNRYQELRSPLTAARVEEHLPEAIP